MIIARELEPGEHLVEYELAAHLGVSRQPVREALQRLHSERWVDLRPALGAFVHIPADTEADQEGLVTANSALHAHIVRYAAMRPCQISSGRSTVGCGDITYRLPRRVERTRGTNMPN
jgi:DNA-binding GntR family transcriptional regulator